MFQTLSLKAGKATPTNFNAKTLILIDLGAAASVDLSVEFDGYRETFPAVQRNFKVQSDDRMVGCELTASVDCTVRIFVSRVNITANYLDGTLTNAVITNLPLPVSNDRGAPANPVYVSGITYTDAPATAVQDDVPVNVTDAATALVGAAANRKSLRFANNGANDVTLGSVGITWAKRTITLKPGDFYIEERAANLAWYGICNTGLATSVNIQEVLA